jgi:NADH-quinone oxidoreductase subunit G
LNADEAQRLGLSAGGQVRIADVSLPLAIDAAVPDGAAWIEAAEDLTATLPPYGASITLSKA